MSGETMYDWVTPKSPMTTTDTVTSLPFNPSDLRFRRELTADEVGNQMREAKWYVASLPCIICGKALSNVSGSDNQPYGGVAFASSGHYGSTIFDPAWAITGGWKHIEINICDACFLMASQRGHILLIEAILSRPEVSVSLYGATA